MSESKEIGEIREAVEALRTRRATAATSYEPLPELSSQLYAGGEIESFVERQLVPVHFGYGGWQELANSDLRNQVLHYLRAS